MTSSRKELLIAVSLLIGGLLAFFLFLWLMDHDPDKQPLGPIDWVVGGALIGPGFGYLMRWSQRRYR